MSNTNVLLLSAGRRVELLRCFQKAARRLNLNNAIIAGDCSETAPTLYFSDKSCLLPKIDDPDYIESIISICLQEEVALIVPTIDTDLLLLAENKEYIEERTAARVLVSDTRVITICRDKIKTQRFMEENGFGVPAMYTEEQVIGGNLTFPLFIKPKSGSSSVNAFKVNNYNELVMYQSIIQQPIIQDFVDGQEYTVDVFLDFESTIITVVPRLRIATRSGEILKGKIVKDQEIMDDVTRLMNLLKPVGHITVQLMKTSKGVKYIEINPRFGGGAPMSIQCGADSCENLFRLLLGERLKYNENYRDNVTFMRFDSSICIDENQELVQW
ncbi:carbamoyl-phosphate synthase large subunit [Paenibacillus phyllosphaerae]|uniref:Carbamoyl-phosphate synthase large subunit n=1 Tax=Paenibacillus phyllosphaerae TaxID=274593 RepID=A0A7W5AYC7_9BACL|nr:ATP-grasp domain-containing protein [Paenibacillus phyllosphaerae]MBB3110566.1 carbamoyl-phosphate synthase large subunit [Paenibacillus phyllosphaerae]